MKVGIVVPFSWSYWGGVVEHAENQARALMELGHEARIVIGNDPPGLLTTLLHPRAGRHGSLPDFVIPVGRTVIVPANASLSNVCLTPQSMRRMKRAFEREQFDVVHVHEPLAPVISQYALAAAPCPIVATSHAAGGRWWKWGPRFWSALIPRIDYLIAVSEEARRAAEPCLGGPFEIIPNGVGLPESPDPGARRHHVAFIGRHEPRKGLHVLLRAWPGVHRRTGARLRLMGADPLAVRFLLRRLAVPEDGIDILGVVTAEVRDEELVQRQAARGPGDRLGDLRHGADRGRGGGHARRCLGHPRLPRGGRRPDGDHGAPWRPRAAGARDRRVARGRAAPRRDGNPRTARSPRTRYSWPGIAARLVEIYGSLTSAPAFAGAAGA